MKEENDCKLFAALKLIEQLYIDGRIPGFMYENILNEYSGRIDLSQFKPPQSEGTCFKECGEKRRE